MSRKRVILLDGDFEPAEEGAPRIPCPYLVPVPLGSRKEMEARITTGKQYLIKHGGRWYIGWAGMLWFGPWFSVGSHSLQYDQPGTNSSSWEYLYEMHDGDTDDGEEET